MNKIDGNNTTIVPLLALGEWVGEWTDVSSYPGASFSVRSDQAGTLFAEYSHDGVSVESMLSYKFISNINEVHKLTTTRQYMRLRVVNSEATPQTYLNVTNLVGDFSKLTAPSNLPLGLDSDASVIRVISEEIDIARGLRAGIETIQKFGRNSDIDTGSTEDIWNGGSLYTGFPEGAAETIEVFSSSAADTDGGAGAHEVILFGLDENFVMQSAVVNLAGTTPVVVPAKLWKRMNRARITRSGSGNTAFSVGEITARHTTTPANVFMVMPAATNQTNIAGYTVPAGYTGFLRQIRVTLKRSSSASAVGALYVKSFGLPPRLIRTFSLSQTNSQAEKIFGGIELAEKSDIIIRILTVSANNTDITASLEIRLIANE